MGRIAIIGGSGMNLLPYECNRDPAPGTRWGDASAAPAKWQTDAHELMFLPRHGVSGTIAPHAVNYRANLQLVKDFAADWVIAVNAVGGIAAEAEPGWLVIPDQLIDYSWGRSHSYYDDAAANLEFVDFTYPYSSGLRESLSSAAQQAGVNYLASGTYAVTQGPRLETAAEIDRLERDGCQVVGMTSMPEAGLARELRLEYASLAVVVNRAAGRGDTAVHAQIEQHLAEGMASAGQVLTELQKLL